MAQTTRPRPSSRPRRMRALAATAGIAAILIAALIGLEQRPAWAAEFTWTTGALESGGLLLIDAAGGGIPTFVGTGNEGDTVVVSATDTASARSYQLCTALVAGGGAWSCTPEAVPDFLGSLEARVVAGAQAGSTAGPLAHAALNPPRFTDATALGRDYLTATPSSLTMSGETYDGGPEGGSPTTVSIAVSETSGFCTATVEAGAFSCTLDLGGVVDGVYPYTATAFTAYGISLPRSGIVVVDTSVDFVSITAPRNGQVVADLTPTLAGTGEPGATVYPMIYPSFQPACTPPRVSEEGRWRCTMTAVSPGSYTLWSYQVDLAGNVGPSTEGSLTFSVVAPPPPADPPPPPPADPAPAPAAVEPVETPSPTPTPVPTAEPTVEPTTEPAVEAAPAPSARASGQVGAGGAADPTVFGSSLRTPLEVLSTPPAVIAGTVAGAASFVLFVAFPAELLNAAVRENYDRLPAWGGRVRRRSAALLDGLQRRTGRGGAVALVALAVAALTVLVDPNAGPTLATLRLWIAIAAALIVVNLVLVGALRLAARRWFAVEVLPRILPGAIVLTVITVIASRALDISPGIVFGLLLGLSLARELSTIESGRLAALSTGVLLALGGGAWMLHASLLALGTPDPGFAELIAREALVAITVESLSSLAIAMLPIAFMDGRAIWSWSRRVWGLLAAIALLAFVLVIVPMPDSWAETTGPLSTTVIAFAGFGVVSFLVWFVLQRRGPTAPQPRVSAEGTANR